MEIIELVQKIDREVSKRGMGSTLLGTVIYYDELGRPLNADANYRFGQVIIENKTYTKICRGWESYYFEGHKPYMSYKDGTHFHMIDETPSYIKK